METLSYGARSSCAGLVRAAASAGATARRFATAMTPPTSPTTSQIGTTETGMTPRLVANTLHIEPPATMPNGTPTTIPTRANVVACQATADATWPFTNPSAFNSPVSRRRRDTLTTSR